jgi:hypothetical protein
MATIDNTLKRYGIDDAGDMAVVERMRKQYSEQALGYKAQIDAIENNREQYIKEADAYIKKEAKPGMSVDAAVSLNTRLVSENLYSMDAVKARIEAERAGMKKSILVFIRRRVA